MEIISKIKAGIGQVAELGVSLLALGIVLEVLGMTFIPGVNVIGNVSAIVATLGSQGLVGLIAVWVLYEIWKRK